MAKNKWMQKLAKLDGAVNRDYKPFNHVIRSGSPSVNFAFGNTHGIPLGYTAVLYGPAKGGKSYVVNTMIGQLHKDDPEAIVVKYNTEYRELVQLTDRQLQVQGIDLDRYQCYQTNQPAQIFDKIANEIRAMCQEGAPIKLIVIDSISSVLGRRFMNSDTIETQQIGDEAKTVQDGLKMILSTIRDYNIALLIITQMRSEMDPIEQRRGNTTKMAGAFALKHFAEYFICVEPNRSAAGKVDQNGNEYVDDTKADLLDHGDKTAHRVRVQVKDSSIGPKGRVGEFTLDYDYGIINVHEEVFLLGTKRGIFVQPNNRTYVLPNFPKEGQESRWTSKADCLNAIKENDELSKEIVKRVRNQDIDAMEKGRPQTITKISETNQASDDEGLPEELQ